MQGADIQSKVEELEDLNNSLREQHKVKDDAIATLSDQLLVHIHETTGTSKTTMDIVPTINDHQ